MNRPEDYMDEEDKQVGGMDPSDISDTDLWGFISNTMF